MIAVTIESVRSSLMFDVLFLSPQEIPKRVAVIEKWAAVADICRCLHNFNGVLQICASFTNSSVFRLKRTWEKLSKTVNKQHNFQYFHFIVL